ncbi:MAG: [protein-PII] uridylyltransferase [Succinivibrionaceae bacterium]
MNYQTLISRFLTRKDLDRTSGRMFIEVFNKYLAKEFYSGTDIIELTEARCYLIDQIIIKLYMQFGLSACDELAVIAVGGYGRKELHPFTDIDILFVTLQQLSPVIAEKVSAFITLLWDFRLDVGQAVRTVDECVQEGGKDITIATNLLETRLICGSMVTYNRLKSATNRRRFWPIADFFTAKMEEQKTRHEQYENGMYMLEPDLKNMCGGLRDVQTIMWIARKFTDAQTMEEICQQGFITRSECRDLLSSEYFLWRVRFALQIAGKKNDNRLTFDRQVEVARIMGYIGEGNVPVENLMIRFYQTTQRISEINEMVLQLFKEAIFGETIREHIKVLNARFILRGHFLDIVDPRLFIQHPSAIMEMFALIASLAASPQDVQVDELYPNCVRSLRNARLQLKTVLSDIPESREHFINLFNNPPGCIAALNLMIKHGVMGMYMPEWIRISGQMQFDMFHSYTVDEHTYRTIRNIHHFSQSNATDVSKSLFRNIYRNLPKQSLLYLAALFHDIGKGSGHHAQVGAQIARLFCQKHNFLLYETRLVTWLVEHHLDFSITAQRRDISDPNVIQDFARVVQDEIRLDYLYCLSIADICATNDTSWNSWKDVLFKQLYYAIQNALRQDPNDPADLQLSLEENKNDALQGILQIGFREQDVLKLWSTFDDSYFIRHSGDQIFWHTSNILNYDRESGIPLILFGQSVNHQGTELFIYMKEFQGVFAKIVGILQSRQLSILSACIISSNDGFIMDNFTIMDRNSNPLLPEKLVPLKKYLIMKLMDPNYEPKITSRLPRKYRQFRIPTNVRFLDIEGATAQGVTHIEISALDRPGLLAVVAEAFHKAGIGILAARIATTGERADDGFTITLNGRSLDENEKEELKKAIITAVDSMPEED